MKYKLIIIFTLCIFFNSCHFENHMLSKINNVPYEHVGQFSEGFFPVMQDGVGGYLDVKGNIVIPMEYEVVTSFSNGLASVKKNGKYGCINAENEIVIPFDYDSALRFQNGISVAKKEGKCFLIDKENHIVSNRLYDYLTIVEREESPNYLKSELFGKDIYVTDGNKRDYMDRNGNLFSGLVYDDMRISHDNAYILVKSDNLWGCIDINNNVIIPVIYEKIDYAGEGHFIVRKDASVQLLNDSMEILIDCKDDSINYIGADFIQVWEGAIFEGTLRETIYDRRGNRLFESPKDHFVSVSGYDYLYLYSYAQEQTKVGIIDRAGTEIIPIKYDQIRRVSEHLFIATEAESCVLLDIETNTKKSFPYYEEIFAFQNGYAIVCTQDKYGVISEEGTEVIPMQYNEITKQDHYYYCEKGYGIDIFEAS